MAGITRQGTTFNLPNYVGELFATSPQDTPLLSSIGGLTGGREADATLFGWSTFDLRDAEDDRQRLEGADAPTPEARVRAFASNVVEIHQEALELSYTKLAAVGQFADVNSAHPEIAGLLGSNAVREEIAWQMRQHLLQVARDVEASFTTGTFQEPADNTRARKTRSILEAIDTNKRDALGEDFSVEFLLDLMQDVWESGGISVDETRTLLCAGTQKRRITSAFITDANYRQDSRDVGGVHVDVIETDFGKLNVMLDRFMPADTIAVLSLEQLAPRFLPIPGKGHFFVEPLAKSGAAEKFQLYGEIGLEYGSEIDHGKIEGLSVDVAS